MNTKHSHQGQVQHSRSHTQATVAKVVDASSISESVGEVRAVATKLGLNPAEATESRRTIAAEGAVPPAFAEVAIEAASQFPELSSSGFDVAAVTAAQNRAAVLTPLRTAVRVLLRQIEDDILREKAVVGSQSRALYKYLQGLSVTPSGAVTREQLDRMAAAMRKKRSVKSPTPATPAAASSPTASDSQSK